RSCRESKIKVIPWTVNDKDSMKKLISFGVDGIISDYPDRLKSVQSEKK
ncbi:MAG TPA: glycerophosphodiester phosphodiesterase family protein, partial [Leptospiraceae bacterium]|nr:glycerophosphodiester phosphodiesterase family protein [Leptospiraceae bacterium]